MATAIEKDAREFGLHDKQGGWRLGLLVARNVEREGGASNPRSENHKVSARQFAADSSTTHSRVLRYLDAWNRAAKKKLVPASNALIPGEEPELNIEALPDWKEFFTPKQERSQRAQELSAVEKAYAFIEKDIPILATSDEENAGEVLEALIRHASTALEVRASRDTDSFDSSLAKLMEEANQS
jgi:hypothetical protein